MVRSGHFHSNKPFIELLELKRLLNKAEKLGTVRKEARVAHDRSFYPIYSVSFGSQSPTAPCLFITGGIHGLEKIGTSVANAFMLHTMERMHWDVSTQKDLEAMRIVFMPLLNPVGMHRNTRANGNGVDLMRNSPIVAENESTLPLLAGQRISPRIPWYMGKDGLELEAQTLERVFERETKDSELVIALDIHSGFGAVDRIWFPYAHTATPIENIGYLLRLKHMLDRNLPNHVYEFEPQAHQYTTHGDLWDYLYKKSLENDRANRFLPLCLEIGSWRWLKKNPRQLLSSMGLFNPILPHRISRALRTHIPLYDFLGKAVRSYETWTSMTEQDLSRFEEDAMELWYR